MYFPHRLFQKHTLKDQDVIIFTVSSRAFLSKTGVFVFFLVHGGEEYNEKFSSMPWALLVLMY